MPQFVDLVASKQLHNALEDLGVYDPTPIQAQTFPVVLSGKDIVGIAQTGTGKTFAYLLPILQQHKYSKEKHPSILILVPTRELVDQVVETIQKLTEYMSVRVLGVYGGTNINTQKIAVEEGQDIIVATPGRVYDLIVSRALQVKNVKKLVIDEVDVMLDLGFRFQLGNILDLLPKKRQNIMFSATMTEEVNELIQNTFVLPETISIAVSGTPLENIHQQAMPVHNFNTKLNLIEYLLQDKQRYQKVILFLSTKKQADQVFERLEERFGPEVCVIHSNKSQNYRIRSVEAFESGDARIIVATDVMARGLDFEKVSHVISYDVPEYPENYMHRIGRTGRATERGVSILFFTDKEKEAKKRIEMMMEMSIEEYPFPEAVEINPALIDEERPKSRQKNLASLSKQPDENPGVHERKAKNRKENLGSAYKRKIAEKYKKPQTKGDKFSKKRNKK